MLTACRRRDRDQVVYRETAPSRKLLKEHYLCKNANPKERHKTCDQCTENVKRVPRIVMVDQLWMWVLDRSKSIPRYSTTFRSSV